MVGRGRRPQLLPLIIAWWWRWWWLLCCCHAVQLRFDDPTAGFFLRSVDTSTAGELAAGTAVSPSAEPDGLKDDEDAGDERLDAGERLLSRQFALLKSSQTVVLRASYGPFLTSQSVAPAFSQLPLAADTESNAFANASSDALLIATAASESAPSHHQYLDLSAHLVTREVRKDQPVLRVVFHVGQSLLRHGALSRKKSSSVCIVLSAQLTSNRTVESTCTPQGEDGTCLGEVTIPAGWWPSLTASRLAKQPKVVVRALYWLVADCSRNPGHQVLSAPTLVGELPLTLSQMGYRQLAGDELLHLLIPQTPLYPVSRLYVPVFLEQPREGGGAVGVVAVKCRARQGVRILGVEETSRNWTLRVELNAKGTAGTVTAFRKDASLLANMSHHESGPEEIFNWLYGVEASEVQIWEGGKLSWHVKYQKVAASGAAGATVPGAGATGSGLDASTFVRGPRLRHRLEVKKDDVQAVIPISKSWELMNTAVLTGKQVSQPMKVFIVSQGGEIADVTLHTSCHTSDDSALKVSSSCTSVYVDGSETRGAIAAQVQVKYGSLSGSAEFRVWMAEIPLIVEVADPKLSLVKSWTVPHSSRSHEKRSVEGASDWRDQIEEQSKLDEEKTRKMEEGATCQNRFQQTRVQVYARFLAEDPDSGRRETFISRSSQLDVTELTLRSLRTADPRVASLTGSLLRAHEVGRTEVQVMSPVTGRVIGTSEVRVVKSKEAITGLRVRVITGIGLAIAQEANNSPGLASPASVNLFNVETRLADKLNSKYQEGLLDIHILYSDGSSTPLREVDPDDYYLTVDSLDPNIIAFAPVAGSKDPRVIAVGSGEGDLLAVSLELPDDCHDKQVEPLAIAPVYVHVNLDHSRRERVINNNNNVVKIHRNSSLSSGKRSRKKGGERARMHSFDHHSGIGNIVDMGQANSGHRNSQSMSSMKSVDMADLSEILSNIALRDDNSRDNADRGPSLKNHNNLVGGGSLHQPTGGGPYGIQSSHHHEATTLEVGMYILLGVFCVAIAVFMASCFVYASKQSGSNSSKYPAGGHHHHHHLGQQKSVQNAHDWVWLGRQSTTLSGCPSLATSGSREDGLLSAAAGGGAAVDPAACNSILSREYRREIRGEYYLRDPTSRPPHFGGFVNGRWIAGGDSELTITPNPCEELIGNASVRGRGIGSDGRRYRINGAGSGLDFYAELPRNHHSAGPAASGGPSNNNHRRSPRANRREQRRLLRHQQNNNGSIASHTSIESVLLLQQQQQDQYQHQQQQLMPSLLAARSTFTALVPPPPPQQSPESSHRQQHRQQQQKSSLSNSSSSSSSPSSSSRLWEAGHRGITGNNNINNKPKCIINNNDIMEGDGEMTSPSSSVQSRPSINSATYTRPKPVLSQQGAILPVGYPIFCTRGAETSGGGFQNPWEALHHQQQQRGQEDRRHRDHHFFQEEDEDEVDDCYKTQHPQQQQPQHPGNLSLDLDEDPPPYYDDLVDKQSPASALPPLDTLPAEQQRQNNRGTSAGQQQQQQKQQLLLITPEHIRQPRGEYIPLNPDIEKPHPPRWAASAAGGIVEDPFNVSDEEAPPVPAECLSPGHIFASISDIHAAIGRHENKYTASETSPERSCTQSEEEYTSENDTAVDDDLPDPKALLEAAKQSPTTFKATSPSSAAVVSSPYGTYSKVIKKPTEKVKSPSTSSIKATDLEAVAIGALDYEQLMNYFEGLKESAA